MLVKEIMAKNVVTVTPEMTIRELNQILKTHRISGVPVVNSANDVVGVVTLSDILKIIAQFYNWHETDRAYYWTEEEKSGKVKKIDASYLEDIYKKSVSEIMNALVITLKEDDPAQEAMKLMFTYNIHTIPVLKDNKLVGVIGKHDLLEMSL